MKAEHCTGLVAGSGIRISLILTGCLLLTVACGGSQTITAAKTDTVTTTATVTATETTTKTVVLATGPVPSDVQAELFSPTLRLTSGFHMECPNGTDLFFRTEWNRVTSDPPYPPLQTQLYEDNKPVPWWPVDQVVEADDYGWEIVVPLVQDGITYTLSGKRHILKYWEKGNPARYGICVQWPGNPGEYNGVTPQPGAIDVPAAPLFTWPGTTDADGNAVRPDYELIVSTSSRVDPAGMLAAPDVLHLTGADRISGNAYKLPEENALQAGAVYYWQVRAVACDVDGATVYTSAWSDVYAFATVP